MITIGRFREPYQLTWRHSLRLAWRVLKLTAKQRFSLQSLVTVMEGKSPDFLPEASVLAHDMLTDRSRSVLNSYIKTWKQENNSEDVSILNMASVFRTNAIAAGKANTEEKA